MKNILLKKKHIEESWFPKKKLIKLEIKYAGRQQELRDHQNEFIDEKTSNIEKLQLLVDSLEARGAVKPPIFGPAL